MATVDGVPIPWESFTTVYELKIGKYLERGREVPPTAARRYRLSLAKRLVYQELLEQEVEALGVDYEPVALEMVISVIHAPRAWSKQRAQTLATQALASWPRRVHRRLRSALAHLPPDRAGAPGRCAATRSRPRR